MPRPKKGESKREFMSRAIPIILKEDPRKTRSQAAGKAAGMYDSYKAKTRGKK